MAPCAPRRRSAHSHEPATYYAAKAAERCASSTMPARSCARARSADRPAVVRSADGLPESAESKGPRVRRPAAAPWLPRTGALPFGTSPRAAANTPRSVVWPEPAGRQLILREQQIGLLREARSMRLPICPDRHVGRMWEEHPSSPVQLDLLNERTRAFTGVSRMGDTGLENGPGAARGCYPACLLALGVLRSRQICSQRNINGTKALEQPGLCRPRLALASSPR